MKQNNPMPAQFILAARCGAITRRKTLCQQPAMPNGRCRMHGGLSTGPPKGNQNALKHGRFTESAKAERKAVRELIKQARKMLATL